MTRVRPTAGIRATNSCTSAAVPSRDRRCRPRTSCRSATRRASESVEKNCGVEVEHRVELQQDGHGERSLIVLELIDIARRQFEYLRQCELGQVAFFA